MLVSPWQRIRRLKSLVFLFSLLFIISHCAVGRKESQGVGQYTGRTAHLALGLGKLHKGSENQGEM